MVEWQLNMVQYQYNSGMTRITIRVALILLMVLASLTRNIPAIANQDQYTLNTSAGAPYATKNRSGFQDLIVAEVFRRLGLKGQVERYDASARALINANNNIDHGVAMRIKGLDKKFPNLIRVEERLIENDFVAYSKNLDFSTNDWTSLKPYRATYIHGWAIFERNLPTEMSIHAVKKPRQMFEMLTKDRVDVVLYERWQGLQRAKETGLKVKIHQPSLASVDLYMYMHKNHAHLVPKMAEALRDMKTDGTYQAIFDRTLTALFLSN